MPESRNYKLGRLYEDASRPGWMFRYEILARAARVNHSLYSPDEAAELIADGADFDGKTPLDDPPASAVE